MSKKIVALFAVAAAVYGGLMYAAAEASAGTPGGTLGGNPDWVCDKLDNNPTSEGMWDVVAEAAKRGHLTEAGGRAVAQHIINECPEHIPAVMEWVNENE